MSNKTFRSILPGFCSLMSVLALLAVTAEAQTSTTTKTKGAATTTTREESGTVTYIDGNTIVIKMSNGEVRTVTVPETRTAMIDGKETTVRDLKVGTTLNATYTTTTTPVTERTVSQLKGTVWYVSGVNVILTLPDGKNKMYKARPEMKFDVGGQKATVFDLKKGMRVSVEKIEEQPFTEVASNSVVTGHAPPPPKPVAVAAAAPAPAPAPARVAEAPAPTPAPAPAAAAAPEPAPARLPKTGSSLPLVGLLGLLLTGAGLSLRRFRRS